uniref:RhoGEF guanine nucleotide exchange factor n=1 Tax=uncultured bacterium contig00224 TaxID=1181613 RepID=A0A806K1S3_9BACT|nr:RhoGEF guanine nucleotide exchange factor [uncultured bacterium contig00224]
MRKRETSQENRSEVKHETISPSSIAALVVFIATSCSSQNDDGTADDNQQTQTSSSSVSSSSSADDSSSSAASSSSGTVESSSSSVATTSSSSSSSSQRSSSSSLAASSSSRASSSSQGAPVDESVAGDYSKPERWIANGGDGSKGVDIFLATPTGNISGGASYASFEDAKASATTWGRGVESLFKDATNIYHAVYRYACISGCSDASMDNLSTNDILAAFDYYWENYNKGERPFILLGFSQGAYVLWNLVWKRIANNPEIGKYHIVTYALGSPGRGSYRDATAANVNKVFSQSPDDLNKVTCFAPYHESDDVSGMGAAFKVNNGSPTNNPITNPITWTTDADYHACPSGMCSSNVSGAQVDYAKGVLIVNTTASPNGSWGYHGQETTFFAGSIKQNIKDRITAWNETYK